VRRVALPERPDWKAQAEELGFRFHTMHGEPYWDETSAYAFSLDQIETGIEDPATALHAMAREAAAKVAASEALMDRFAIPPDRRDLVAESWRADEPALYGRMDLAWDGTGPAKLLEYNADTPTSVYEAASFQWLWFEQQAEAGVLPDGADQFNAIHDALVARWRETIAAETPVHFTCFTDSAEDFATVEYLAWTAAEAGLTCFPTPIEAIGLTDRGQFADDQDRVIATLFKLYPWEDMLRDDFAAHVEGSGCRFVEPPWKAILSNKALLPLLWEMFPGHPNLLPAFFAADLDSGRADAAALGPAHVLKPVFSREGASVTIVEDGAVTEAAADRGYDDHPMIAQTYHPLPVFDGWRPVLGAWIVGEACVGLGVREDRGRITQDLSRFKPHFIEG
jgi:glutathionylspermidine synthase